MSRVRDFVRSQTFWLSFIVGITVIPFVFAQILGALGAWRWLSQLYETGNDWAFWVAYFLSRVLFGLAWFMTWRFLEDLAVKVRIFASDDGVFGTLLPSPNYATWTKIEHIAFNTALILINFSAADVAIALYTWAPPPYFG